MPIRTIVLTEQEEELIEEVRQKLGFDTIEETLSYLSKKRLEELLAKLAGNEIKRKTQRHFF